MDHGLLSTEHPNDVVVSCSELARRRVNQRRVLRDEEEVYAALTVLGQLQDGHRHTCAGGCLAPEVLQLIHDDDGIIGQLHPLIGMVDSLPALNGDLRNIAGVNLAIVPFGNLLHVGQRPQGFTLAR